MSAATVQHESPLPRLLNKPELGGSPLQACNLFVPVHSEPTAPRPNSALSFDKPNTETACKSSEQEPLSLDLTLSLAVSSPPPASRLALNQGNTPDPLSPGTAETVQQHPSEKSQVPRLALSASRLSLQSACNSPTTFSPSTMSERPHSVNSADDASADRRWRGVYRCPGGRFKAQITTPGNKTNHLGMFKTAESAARAWDMAAIRNRGRGTALNFDVSDYIVSRDTVSLRPGVASGSRRSSPVMPSVGPSTQQLKPLASIPLSASAPAPKPMTAAPPATAQHVTPQPSIPVRPVGVTPVRRTNSKESLDKSGKPKWRGVYLLPGGRYKAQIAHHDKAVHLGNYATAIEAARAWDIAAITHRGTETSLNFSVKDYVVEGAKVYVRAHVLREQLSNIASDPMQQLKGSPRNESTTNGITAVAAAAAAAVHSEPMETGVHETPAEYSEPLAGTKRSSPDEMLWDNTALLLQAASELSNNPSLGNTAMDSKKPASAAPKPTMQPPRFALDGPRDAKSPRTTSCGTPRSDTASPRDNAARRLPWRGVYQRGTRYKAQITVEANKKVHLGMFATPEAAARAWDVAALRIRGAGSALNFDPEDYVIHGDSVQLRPGIQCAADLSLPNLRLHQAAQSSAAASASVPVSA